MVSISEARSVVAELVNQPIWNVRRSHGSCFLAEFGAVKDHLTLPRRDIGNGQSIPERRVPVGVWSLLVEQCEWRMGVGEKQTSHRDEDHAHMQAIMDLLEQRLVTYVALDKRLLVFGLSSGVELRLGGAMPVKPRMIGDQWSLTLRDGRALSRDTTGAFSFA